MSNDPATHAVAALEETIFKAMTDAYREGDFEMGDRFYKVWIKLPNKRAWPVGQG